MILNFMLFPIIINIYSSSVLWETELSDMYTIKKYPDYKKTKNNTKNNINHKYNLSEKVALPYLYNLYKNHKRDFNQITYIEMFTQFFSIVVLITLIGKLTNIGLLIISQIIITNKQINNQLFSNITKMIFIYTVLLILLQFVKLYNKHKTQELYQLLYEKSVPYFLKNIEQCDIGQLKSIGFTRIFKSFETQMNILIGFPKFISAKSIFIYCAPFIMLSNIIVESTIYSLLFYDQESKTLKSRFSLFKYMCYYKLPMNLWKTVTLLLVMSFIPLLTPYLYRNHYTQNIENMLDQISNNVDFDHYFTSDLHNKNKRNYYTLVDSTYFLLTFLVTIFFTSSVDNTNVISNIYQNLLYTVTSFCSTDEDFLTEPQKQLLQKELNNIITNNTKIDKLTRYDSFLTKNIFSFISQLLPINELIILYKSFSEQPTQTSRIIFILQIIKKLAANEFYKKLNDAVIQLDKNRFNSNKQEQIKNIQSIALELGNTVKDKFKFDPLTANIDTLGVKIFHKNLPFQEFFNLFSEMMQECMINNNLYKNKQQLLDLIDQVQNTNLNNVHCGNSLRNMLLEILESSAFASYTQEPTNVLTNNILLNSVFLFTCYLLINFFITYSMINRYTNLLKDTVEYMARKHILTEINKLFSNINVTPITTKDHETLLSVDTIGDVHIKDFGYAYNIRFPHLKMKVFSNTTFQVESGINVIVGPSGVGKSSLLSILLKHMISSNKDSIESEITTIDPLLKFKKYKLSEMSQYTLGNGISYIPQLIRFDKKLSILEATKLTIGENANKEIYTKILRLLLDKQGLNNIKVSRQFYSLSGGQKQRAGMAIILLKHIVNDNMFIFADEPTSNVDSFYRYKVNSLICNDMQQLKLRKYQTFIYKDNPILHNKFHNNLLAHYNVSTEKLREYKSNLSNKIIVVTHTIDELLMNFHIKRLHIINKNKKITHFDKDDALYDKLIYLYNNNQTNIQHNLNFLEDVVTNDFV